MANTEINLTIGRDTVEPSTLEEDERTVSLVAKRLRTKVSVETIEIPLKTVFH